MATNDAATPSAVATRRFCGHKFASAALAAGANTVAAEIVVAAKGYMKKSKTLKRRHIAAAIANDAELSAQFGGFLGATGVGSGVHPRLHMKKRGKKSKSRARKH